MTYAAHDPTYAAHGTTYAAHDPDCDTGISDDISESCSGYYSGIGTSEVSHSEKFHLKPSLTIDETSEDDITSDWDDDEGDDDSDWGEDEWPLDHPLPLPEWGCERPELQFSSQDQYQKFLDRTKIHLRQCLDSLSYDTFSNFMAFSMKYMSSHEEYCNLPEFYRDYNTPLLPGRYSCVGLSLDLSSRLSHLERIYPGLKDAMYQVSVEEDTEKLIESGFKTPPAKTCLIEHVMLCIRVRISGRVGVVLFDPGYHVSQPITVMEDGLAPQTGTIMGSTTRSDVTRAYNYRYSSENSSFIEWTTVEKRGGEFKKEDLSVIHPSKPFLSSVDVAERRNLIYPFKTLLGRDGDGHLKCGLYFPIRECSKTSVTLFHQVSNLPHQKKVPLTYFLSENPSDDEVETAVVAVAAGTGRTTRDLRSNLTTLAHLLNDSEFVQEVVSLEKEILNIGVIDEIENRH